MEARYPIALVQTIADFPRAVVLLFKLPLYESFMEARPAIALVQTIAEFPRAAVLLFKLPFYESFWTIASYSSSKSWIYGGQVSDRIGPDDCRIPPRGGITLQATALRVT